MKTEHRANLDAQVKLEAWLGINDPDMTIEEAVARCEAAGNEVLEVDKENRRIKAIDTEILLEKEVWACEKCGAYSTSKQKILDHEVDCNGSINS